MFCPKCAAENDPEQAYCRQCGQRLSGVRLALEGRADQSLEKLKSGEKVISGGGAALAAFTLIAVAIALLGILVHDLSFGYIAFINLLLGALTGLPLVYLGKARLKRAAYLLVRPDADPTHARLDPTSPKNDLLTAELNAGLARPQLQGSVTEHTTLDLNRSDR
jgi:hypothetical protein